MFSSDYYFYIGNEIKTLWSDNGLYYNHKYNIDRYPFILSGPNVNSSNPKKKNETIWEDLYM